MSKPNPTKRAPDFRRLQKRLSSGKTLSPSELETLQEFAGKPSPSAVRFATSQSELARVLGVSRQLVAWHRRQPGAPKPRLDGRHDVAAWRSHLEIHGRLDTAARVAGGSQISRLKLEHIVLENRMLERRIDILEKAYLSLASVESAAAKLTEAIGKVVQGNISSLAPSLVGLSVAEADVALREKEDEIMQQLHTLHTSLSES